MGQGGKFRDKERRALYQERHRYLMAGMSRRHCADCGASLLRGDIRPLRRLTMNKRGGGRMRFIVLCPKCWGS